MWLSVNFFFTVLSQNKNQVEVYINKLWCVDLSCYWSMVTREASRGVPRYQYYHQNDFILPRMNNIININLTIFKRANKCNITFNLNERVKSSRCRSRMTKKIICWHFSVKDTSCCAPSYTWTVYRLGLAVSWNPTVCIFQSTIIWFKRFIHVLQPKYNNHFAF